MKAARLPSGETLELRGGAAAPVAESWTVHAYAWRSHRTRRLCAFAVIERMSSENSIVWNGSRFPSKRPPGIAALSAVASREWSNADALARRAGSTSMNSEPFGRVVRYQNRPSGSQLARTPAPVTSGAVVVPRNFSARA